MTGSPFFTTTRRSGVTFASSDAGLLRVFREAERKLAGNRIAFGELDVLVEGGGYDGAYLETQPMGGEMYAKRDVQVALNNQQVFLFAQRADGRLPAKVFPLAKMDRWRWQWDLIGDQPPVVQRHPELGIGADFANLQGFNFPDPAWKTYFWIGRDRDYLLRLRDALVAYDAYLWRTRDSDGDGILETWCVWDTGEDRARRLLWRGAPSMWPFDRPPSTPGLPTPQDPDAFRSYWIEHGLRGLPPPTPDRIRVPFASMDIMAYSYDCRSTLARIHRELGDGGAADAWAERAEEVRRRVVRRLWIEDRHACFDRDREGRILPDLLHNNLRVMHHGLFTQDMADAFIREHLLDPAGFWTPFPLPSIAITDPLFHNDREPGWSGPPAALTYQRAIRALENYGHHAEVMLLGKAFLAAVIANGCAFRAETDPFVGTSKGEGDDGYGPAILSALEYLSRMHGIHVAVDIDQIWWSCLDSPAHDFAYTQAYAGRVYRLTRQGDEFRGEIDGRHLLTARAGQRIITSTGGSLIAAVGIASRPVPAFVATPELRLDYVISSNEVWSLASAPAVRSASVPFPIRGDSSWLG